MRLRIALILIALDVASYAAPGLAAPAAQVSLAVAGDRSATMAIWAPARVDGVVLFSTGHGSWPEKYDAIVSAWNEAGFAVIAPVHVDSLHHPNRDQFSREASFGERIADLSAASDYAARTWPGKPQLAAGHSFGTLTALCLSGALSSLGDFRVPAVKGVLGFSSPGKVPGLVGPDAYASVAAPILVITGDQDTVPGLVTDWRDHLLPVQTAPEGANYAVAYRDAGHEMIGDPEDPDFASAAAASIRFLRAYGLDDASARRTLMDAESSAEAEWIKR